MSPPWMPLYIGNYLQDTRRLHATEHGAYLLLIMEYWSSGSLPDDDRQLARVACMSEKEWLAIKPVIRSFFGEGWSHSRIDRELAESKAKYEKRAAAGRKGGIQKANGKQNSSNAIAGLQAKDEPGSTRYKYSPTGTEANASGAEAPPAEVRYIDAKDKLRRQGAVDLRALGVKESSIHSLIGRWLKSAHDDADVVSAAIDRAIALRIHNPIPWITSAVVTEPKRTTGPPIRKSPGLSAAEAGMRFLNARRSDEPSQFDLNGSFAGSDQGYGGPGGPLLEQGGGDRWEAEADHIERSRSFG
jgi:uncharacterized protein YdaU (DUF1376 family)